MARANPLYYRIKNFLGYVHTIMSDNKLERKEPEKLGSFVNPFPAISIHFPFSYLERS